MQQLIAIGVVSIIAFIVVSLLVIIKWWQRERKWIKVMATVIAISKGQDWKYTGRSIRDAWSGDWVPEKIWQSYYAVTAQWISPQTQYRHVFSGRCWVKESTAPAVGAIVTVIVHPCNPARYEMIFNL
jgi:hypothetical protein